MDIKNEPLPDALNLAEQIRKAADGLLSFAEYPNVDPHVAAQVKRDIHGAVVLLTANLTKKNGAQKS